MLEPDCPALMSLKETERQLNITSNMLSIVDVSVDDAGCGVWL
jgi:hypothetical protein